MDDDTEMQYAAGTALVREITARLDRQARRLEVNGYTILAATDREAACEIRRLRADNARLVAEVAQADDVTEAARGTIRELRARVAELEENTPPEPQPDPAPPEVDLHDRSDLWEDRLVFDFDVSDSSPVVKETWVTTAHVVSLIVDGYTWHDIIRTHPELTEDDIRACLAYSLE